jgi:hypothetical protein
MAFYDSLWNWGRIEIVSVYIFFDEIIISFDEIIISFDEIIISSPPFSFPGN